MTSNFSRNWSKKGEGIYPQGTIVELSTGEVAIVLGTNKTQRLRPQILIVLDATIAA